MGNEEGKAEMVTNQRLDLADDVATDEGQDLAAEVSFEDLGLSEEVLRAIEDLGYETPTPVQAALVPLMRSGLDLVVQARTGTGKTAAFGIPIAERYSGGDEGVRAVVVAPTRELAVQIAAEIDALGLHKHLGTATLYGGVSLRPQVRALGRAQVVVGTPGRLLDHLRRGNLSFDAVDLCVIDEADELLSMGFLEDVEAILQYLPAERQIVLASATIPDAVLRLSERYMTAPEFLSLSSDQVAARLVSHSYYLVLGRSRTRDLLRIIELEQPSNAIIFCNTKADTNLVASYLRDHGYDAEVLNGDLPQKEREAIMKRCKEGTLRFMVATDVAARGIDVSGLSHVINYELPDQVDIYIHRTGRTGRAGASGKAISLVGPQEMGTFFYLRKTYDLDMVFKELPADTAPEEGMASVLARELAKDAALAGAGDGDSEAERRRSGRGEGRGPESRGGKRSRGRERDGSKGRRRDESQGERRGQGRPKKKARHDAQDRPKGKDRAKGQDRPKRKAKGEAEQRRAKERDAKPVADVQAKADKPKKRKKKRTNRVPEGMTRLHVNGGKSLFESKANLKTALVEGAQVPAEAIGRVDLSERYAFVNVKDEHVSALLEKLAEFEYHGKDVHIELAKPKEARP